MRALGRAAARRPTAGTQMTWAVGGDKPRPYVSAFDEGRPSAMRAL